MRHTIKNSTKLQSVSDIEAGSAVYVPRHETTGIVLHHGDARSAVRFLLLRDERGVFIDSQFPHGVLQIGTAAELRIEIGKRAEVPSSPAEAIGLLGADQDGLFLIADLRPFGGSESRSVTLRLADWTKVARDEEHADRARNATAYLSRDWAIVLLQPDHERVVVLGS